MLDKRCLLFLMKVGKKGMEIMAMAKSSPELNYTKFAAFVACYFIYKTVTAIVISLF